ncbi:MAG: ADP-glyceromanno-heptose 6-epimerase [Caulobacteraceae bacterium]|nr:ADP-glyceromanno-heptose 6-epimerase [Caulobacteraceae bacterium]
MTAPVVLVTGGAGFIGSNIVAELTARGDLDVVVCDRLREAASGKWRNLANHPIADLFAPEDLFAWLDGRRVELVVHMGAISSTTEPDADLMLDVNFALSRDLFYWCAEAGSRLIYASSAATYGGGELGFVDAPDEASIAALRPLNAYGWSKQLFDLLVARETSRGHAPPQCVGLRFFNVYGPNEGHKGPMRSVAAQLWPKVAAGEPVSLFKSHQRGVGDGGQKRDFVSVKDVARAAAWFIDHPRASGLFNMGSGEARSFEALALALFAAAGRAPAIDYIPMPETIREKYQYFTEADLTRLRAAGYTAPFASLEDGIGDYVRDHLAGPTPYR